MVVYIVSFINQGFASDMTICENRPTFDEVREYANSIVDLGEVKIRDGGVHSGVHVYDVLNYVNAIVTVSESCTLKHLH